MNIAIVNISSFTHEHAESLFAEGLWGFPDDKLKNNKRRWEKLNVGDNVLLYGEYKGVRGIWFLCNLKEKREYHEPIKYWKKNPTGYPWQIKLVPIFPLNKFDKKSLDELTPLTKDDLKSLGIKIFKQKYDRWSVMVYDENDPQYPLVIKAIENFKNRNTKIILEKPDHEKLKQIIYQIGELQNRYPDTEFPIEDRKLDVIWRKIPRGVPNVVFEIQIGGNLFEALSKLKHANDLWNSIPVLITTEEQIQEAKNWIEGSFHEIRDTFRILSWKDIKDLYEAKHKIKEFERKLGII
jgi:hypothetical protein